MGQLTVFLGKYLGLRFANQTIIPLIRHAFFVDAIKEFGFCPNLLRIDTGTENGLNGKYTMCAERKHGSTKMWIFNCS